MTPSQKNIVKSLAAVAWADGTVKEPEIGMIDSLLWAFGASDDDESEIKEFAKKKRTIKDDVPLGALDAKDRELLLAHAALLTHADGKQTKAEEKLLRDLADHLGVDGAALVPIVEHARQRAEKLASKM
jgi:tellurite resistance protein